MKKKIIKRILISVLGVVLFIGAVIGGYVAYVCIQFYRIDDNTELEIKDGTSLNLDMSKEYTISTYNIGFGAYQREYSFFMDSGEMKDGTKVSGVYAKAKSKESVVTNTSGAISTISGLNADFMFFQEVDKKGNRSYGVNQYGEIENAFANTDITYASNFHSAYLLYPFNDPIGKTEAGIVTVSKYNLSSSVRRSLPVDLSFPTKFFDLDRCLSVNRIGLSNGKELVLINVHLSAYDEGGTIRQQQLKMLNEILSEEREKGNYLIAGGDFNHDITGGKVTFESGQKTPSWVYELTDADLAEGYSFSYSTNNKPTCRSTDMDYTEDENGMIINYTVIIDGFIVSDNIEVSETMTVAQENGLFMYSDHNPVEMKFKLK